MTPRDRMLTTLAHQEPDRVPLTTRLWLDTRIKLRQHYGVETDQELFEIMGIDNGGHKYPTPHTRRMAAHPRIYPLL